MIAFQTALQSSQRLKQSVVALHLCALLVCLFAFYGWMKYLGCFLLVMTFIHAWQKASLKSRDVIRLIEVNREQKAMIVMDSEVMAVEAVLDKESVIFRYAMFLRWNIGERSVWQLVLPDMTSNDAYRRLRVWACWCQPIHD